MLDMLCDYARYGVDQGCVKVALRLPWPASNVFGRLQMLQEVHLAVGELDAHDRLHQVLGLQALEAFGQDLLGDVGSRAQSLGPDALGLDLVDVVVEEAFVWGEAAQSAVAWLAWFRHDEARHTCRRPILSAVSSKALRPAS